MVSLQPFADYIHSHIPCLADLRVSIFFWRTIMLATKTSKKSMSVIEARQKVKALGITLRKMRKTELIHLIQVTEGCIPCLECQMDNVHKSTAAL